MTTKQKEFLLDQLRIFYADMSEKEALEMLIKLSRKPRPPRTISMEIYLGHENKSRKFWDFCQRWKFVGFSFPEIVMTKENKKVPVKIPLWYNITRQNFSAYIEPDHSAFAFCTGEISGITVIDCDTR
jgi:hypothetical protein